MAEAGDEGLWRTNPVFCIDRLIRKWKRSDVAWLDSGLRLTRLIAALRERDIILPPGAADRWVKGRQMPQFSHSPEPRVIGLAVDESRIGHVFPLRPDRASDHWDVDGQLPFRYQDVLDVLTGLLQASGVAEKWSVPERFAFRFENATGLTARGQSMTVAAVLAMFDCMTGFAIPLLRAATALVQLEPRGGLKAVGDIKAKLDAANRECGRLNLIICAPSSQIDCAAAAEVWEVESLGDLAPRLHTAGLLAPLLDAVGPLDQRESARVLERLRSLEQEHHYRDAADLGDRVWHCGFAPFVDPAVISDIARLYASACRYDGRFSDAVRIAHVAYQRIATLGDLACDDDAADAAAEYAASLFNAHRFVEVPPLLECWASAAVDEPRRFRPLTRIKVWNTLGRALAVLRRNGWDELFDRSLALCTQLNETDNIERTTHYRVHARLRHGDLIGARQALDRAPALRQTGSGNVWAACLQANLARLEGGLSTDVILDQLPDIEKPYSSWLYFQATARQAPRTVSDSINRLERAIALLRQDSGVDGNIRNLFATMLELAIAARSADVARWAAAIAKIEWFLSTAADLRAYYRPIIEALPATPDVSAIEKLLNLVPYF